MAEFSNKCAQHKALEGNINQQVFVLATGAMHRPFKTKTGIEGTFLHKQKPKKGAVNVNRNMHVGLGRKLKKAKAILAEEDVSIDCSPPCTQELPKENFLEVVMG